MATERAAGWKGIAQGAASALALAAAYFVLGPDQQSEDANRYLYGIETGWRIWDPHHLLYAPTMRAGFLVAESLGAVSRAYNVARLASAMAAGVGPVLLAWLLREAGVRRAIAWGAGAALATAPVWVRYSTVAETYQIPTAIALAALVLWLRGLRSGGTAWLVGAGATLGLAGLYHQTAAITGAAAVLATPIVGEGGAREGLRRAVLVGVGGVAVALLGFVPAGLALGHRTPAELTEWLRGLQRVSTVWGRMDHFSPAGLAHHCRAWSHAWTPLPGSAAAGACAIGATLAAAVAMRRHPLGAFALVGSVLHGAFNVWWAPWEWEFVVLCGGACAFPALALAAERVGERFVGGNARAAGFAVCAALAVCGGLAWKRQALAFRDRLASRPVEVALGLEATRREAGEDALLVADFAVRDALHLYSDAPAAVAFEDLLEEAGALRVREAFEAGRAIAVDAIPPAVPMRDDRIEGTQKAVRALLAAIGGEEPPQTLPMPEPMWAAGMHERVYVFRREANRVPRAAAVDAMIACARASIRVPIPERELAPLANCRDWTAAE